MLIGCSLLLRPGEIEYQPKYKEKNLHDESVTWHPNFENPQEISLKSKCMHQKQTDGNMKRRSFTLIVLLMKPQVLFHVLFIC